MGNCISTGPTTRDEVLTNIRSALQSYLGEGLFTITLIPVSKDEFSLTDSAPGQMRLLNNRAAVMPELTGTNLVYNSGIPPIYARLFKCTENGTHNTRFLFAWNIRPRSRWRWFIGSPYLPNNASSGSAVSLMTQDVTDQAAMNSVPPIRVALGNMRAGDPFLDAMFVWISAGDEVNFQVKKLTANNNTVFWRTQATVAAVLLTIDEALGGRFDFTET